MQPMNVFAPHRTFSAGLRVFFSPLDFPGPVMLCCCCSTFMHTSYACVSMESFSPDPARKKVYRSMKTPITRTRLQNHFTYSWWKYALLAVLAIFGWNIIYSVTAYRPPEEKKVVLGVYGYGDGVNVNAYMELVRQEQMPDMELLTSEYIVPDEAYGAMILTTRIAARECDLYVMPRTEFQSYVSQGAFAPLDVVLPELAPDLEAAGISLSRGWRNGPEGSGKHLYGIPTAELPGAAQMLLTDTSDSYICLFFETGNDENAARFLDIFVRDLLTAPAAPAAN